MINTEQSIHRSYLNRLLIEIIDNSLLSSNLAFKGGTCAQMLGFLDRFSVDLDFDLVGDSKRTILRKEFHKVFKYLGLIVNKEYDNVLFFQLKYSGKGVGRNSIKLSVNSIKIKSNEYKVQYFSEVDRVMNSQTIETMFANKLVTITDRYNLHKTIAGRDLYDIHHFFVQGYKYKRGIIHERTGLEGQDYFKKLSLFIKKHITQTVVNEDLNSLLPPPQFRQIRKVLIPETLSFILSELKFTTRPT